MVAPTAFTNRVRRFGTKMNMPIGRIYGMRTIHPPNERSSRVIVIGIDFVAPIKMRRLLAVLVVTISSVVVEQIMLSSTKAVAWVARSTPIVFTT